MKWSPPTHVAHSRRELVTGLEGTVQKSSLRLVKSILPGHRGCAHWAAAGKVIGPAPAAQVVPSTTPADTNLDRPSPRLATGSSRPASRGRFARLARRLQMRSPSSHNDRRTPLFGRRVVPLDNDDPQPRDNRFIGDLGG
jgi:hypothetical protein